MPEPSNGAFLQDILAFRTFNLFDGTLAFRWLHVFRIPKLSDGFFFARYLSHWMVYFFAGYPSLHKVSFLPDTLAFR